MKVAHVTLNNRAAGTYLVIFGHNDNGAFRVSSVQSSRTFKSEAGANRAAAKWTAA